jgi:hypothetical protein
MIQLKSPSAYLPSGDLMGRMTQAAKARAI